MEMDDDDDDDNRTRPTQKQLCHCILYSIS